MNPNKLHYLIEYNSEPHYNMSTDEHLLNLVTNNEIDGMILRFYTWSPPAISIGKNQKLINTNKMTVVRRITGGRAIIHLGDLTYSFIAKRSLFENDSILATYKTISQCLIDGLKHLSDDFKFGTKTRKDDIYKSDICFQSLSYGEIQLNGKKILGSAQYRNKIALLQHGSLLLNNDSFELYKKIFNDNTAIKSFTSLKTENIKYDIDTIVNNITNSFKNKFI